MICQIEKIKYPERMFKTLNTSNIIAQGQSWFQNHVWTTETLYQVITIAVAFLIGAFVYRGIKPHIEKIAEKFAKTALSKRIANNLTRLTFPLITLIILSLGATILAAAPLEINPALSIGITKVLAAWIVIRIAVQFIENQALRNFFATIIWIIAALSIFGILDNTTEALDAIAFSVGELRISALAVIKSALLIFGLLYLAIFISGFAERKIEKTKGLTRSSKVLISKIVRVFLIVMAILMGVTSAGIDLSVFAVFGGAIGLGIGFGLQKGISNLFSGMLLLTDRSIKPGDVIELENGTFGWVNHMAARYTEIVSRDNKSFLIPNEDFITQRVTNWSHGSKLIRIEVTFGVAYKHNPHNIKEMAEAAALDAHDRVVKDPAPVCHLAEFGDNALNFKLRFWITDAEKGVTNIRGAVMLALWDAFKEHKIEIPYPQREVYIHESK